MPLPTNEVDPRIRGMYDVATPVEKFLILALVAILGPKKLEDVLETASPKGVDWREVVAGHPLGYWNGKTRRQIEREAGPDVANLVADAYEDRGLELVEDEDGDGVPDAQQRPPAPPQQQQQPQVPANQTTLTDPAEGGEEIIAGYPLSELAGKPDAELLKLEGVTKATLPLIREAEAKAKKK